MSYLSCFLSRAGDGSLVFRSLACVRRKKLASGYKKLYFLCNYPTFVAQPEPKAFMTPRIRPVVLLSFLVSALFAGTGDPLFASTVEGKPVRITPASCKRKPTVVGQPIARIARQSPLRIALRRSMTPDIAAMTTIDAMGTRAATHPFPAPRPSLQDPVTQKQDDKVDDTSLGYRYHLDPQTSVNAKVGWIQDVGIYSDGLLHRFKLARPEDVPSSSALHLRIGGNRGLFSLTGGYIHVIDMEVRPDRVASLSEETDPAAWNSELTCTTTLSSREAVFALGYQRSLEAVPRYLPDERFSSRATVALNETTTLSMEYFHDRGYLVDASFLEDDRQSVVTSIDFKL